MAKKPPEPRAVTHEDVEMGKRVRLRRVEMKMSQAELGQKLGVTFQQIQKYEKGTNRIGASRLNQIATALDVPVTFFFTEKNKKDREVESLLFLDSRFTLRLLRAYSGIKDQRVARDFVALMERVAGIDNSVEV